MTQALAGKILQLWAIPKNIKHEYPQEIVITG